MGVTDQNDASGVSMRPEAESLLNNHGVQGIKLTPGWESAHSNSDIVKALNKNEEEQAPNDRSNLLFIIVLIHGVGLLMPWNMFITAKEYFTQVKLNTSLLNETDPQYDSLRSFNDAFLGYVVNASQLPNLLCNLINLFIQFGGNSLGPRIAGSIIIEILMFVATVVLAMVDSADWPITFFYITICTVVILNSASGIYQNSIYGLSAKLPQKYTGAIVLGTNISGTLTALINIMSIAAAPSQKTAAIYYFISALFILLICLDTYFMLPMLKVYRFYQDKSAKQEREAPGRPPYMTILGKAWKMCFNVFLVFYTTLACFPAVTADIRPSDEDFIISSKYYVAVCCFLLFNFFAMVGNIFPMYFKFPGPRFVWIPVVLRLLFIPFFLYCNFRPDAKTLPTIFGDYAYCAGMIAFALSHGYYSSLTMMYAAHNVPNQYAGVAGQMAAFFLVLGLYVGGNTIFVLKALFLDSKLSE